MKYFLGLAITGKAADWHRELTTHIAEKFGTWKVHEHIPPHVTTYRPFDQGNLEEVEAAIAHWKVVPANLRMQGFGRFEKNAVFAAVVAPAEITEAVIELKRTLGSIPGMPFERLEWHPHATLAYKLPPEKIETLWEYVKTLPGPDFVIPFENVTLYRLENDHWSPYKALPIELSKVLDK